MRDINKIKICICGGGNEAHALASLLGANTDIEVFILTRKPQLWKNYIKAITPDGRGVIGKLCFVSDNPNDVIPRADVIFLSLPSYANLEVLTRISPFVREDTWVGSLPGTGGFDWLCKKILGNKVRIFGLQRVPYISRIIKYGELVSVSGIKKELYVASIPYQEIDCIAQLMEYIFHVKVTKLDNYLAVTLTPSNPILHPARLYGLFHKWTEGVFYDREFLFYEEWDLLSSEVLIGCDEEIQNICSCIPLDLTSVISLKEHYGVRDKYEMTDKLNSIKAFKGIKAATIRTEHGFIPDINSRYFTEDIPYGLVIIRAIAELALCPTPTIDKVLFWSQRLMKKEYLKNNKMVGRDINIQSTAIPQIYGIKIIEQLVHHARFCTDLI